MSAKALRQLIAATEQYISELQTRLISMKVRLATEQFKRQKKRQQAEGKETWVRVTSKLKACHPTKSTA